MLETFLHSLELVFATPLFRVGFVLRFEVCLAFGELQWEAMIEFGKLVDRMFLSKDSGPKDLLPVCEPVSGREIVWLFGFICWAFGIGFCSRFVGVEGDVGRKSMRRGQRGVLGVGYRSRDGIGFPVIKGGGKMVQIASSIDVP